MDASIGAVTSFSTSSGLAPTSVVTTITYGRFIAGSRSVVIFVNETTPKTMTNTTATNTVYGRFTLYFEIIIPPCFAKQNATAFAGAEEFASLFFRRKNPNPLVRESKNRPVGRLIGFSLHHLLENTMRPVNFNIFFRFFDYLHFLCQSFFAQPVYFPADFPDIFPVM